MPRVPLGGSVRALVSRPIAVTRSNLSTSSAAATPTRSAFCERSTVQGNIFSDFLASVGNTPLIKLQGPSKTTGCNIYGKAEFLNPGGSVKDRAAASMIQVTGICGCVCSPRPLALALALDLPLPLLLPLPSISPSFPYLPFSLHLYSGLEYSRPLSFLLITYYYPLLHSCPFFLFFFLFWGVSLAWTSRTQKPGECSCPVSLG